MKKIPQRMCVACRSRKNKSELIRVVYSADGVIGIDASGKKAGRGAYVCRDRACVEQAVKANRLDRGLHTKIDKEVLNLLWKEVENTKSSE